MKKPKHKRRPNPLKTRSKRRPRRSDPLGQLAADRRRLLPPREAPIMQDPIFLHHVASAILRFLELEAPAERSISAPARLWTYEEDARETMAEFDQTHLDSKSVCVYCGKTLTQAYEDSMGMCCVKNAKTYMHEFTKEATE